MLYSEKIKEELNVFETLVDFFSNFKEVHLQEKVWQQNFHYGAQEAIENIKIVSFTSHNQLLNLAQRIDQ